MNNDPTQTAKATQEFDFNAKEHALEFGKTKLMTKRQASKQLKVAAAEDLEGGHAAFGDVHEL